MLNKRGIIFCCGFPPQGFSC
uniref:Uncharacterized protein n=1 Tax=Anguilla anguilla TaxID=7936 RepID=A0A0E9U0Z3_ANGAN